MLFITVRSSAAIQVPKVLQVVEETKRMRHKTGSSYLSVSDLLMPDPRWLGLDDDQELHQYVLYDTGPTAPTQKGPRRINLNDGPDNDKQKMDPKYAPP